LFSCAGPAISAASELINQLVGCYYGDGPVSQTQAGKNAIFFVDSTRNKSLFASFSSEKEESSLF
jgi:hypothetical protein